ncbi:endonuclease/exonuclease/phosphatase family protein [Ectothiorhodospira haloalkaliphila]|nr:MULTISPECIES: endonuclease/exonuclease/phosphatase family protein [Ectothiorhodospira]MCG5496254.1 endonuclease/exonuclease/phosphatase family protein [Ectothiorhodospira variabilis]MCG5523757.1 endonuclease/exonuclease/phosphatase family protein [Ectothiorhodospira haloalkaliphila]
MAPVLAERYLERLGLDSQDPSGITLDGPLASSLSMGPSTPPVQGQRLRILSYNVQVGIASGRFHHYLTNSWKHVLPYGGRMGNLDSIARFIAGFDLVGLQELDAGSLRSNFVNLAEYLSRQSQLPYWYSQTNRNLGKIAKHSLGLLSRYQPHSVMEHRLPSRIPGRGALEAHFGAESGEDSLVIMLVHLSLGRKTRMRQLQYIGEVLRDHEHVVVMGDLNTPTHSAEVRKLVRNTRLQEPLDSAKTYPSWRPMHAFDHILVTPGLGLEQVHVYNLNYSDHLPVGVELVIPDSVKLAQFHAEGQAGGHVRRGAVGEH